MEYWTTKDGEEIAIKDLEDSHLINIINWIKKKAKDGLHVMWGGCGSVAEDMWGEEEELYGKEVEEHFGLEYLIKEAKQRNIYR